MSYFLSRPVLWPLPSIRQLRHHRLNLLIFIIKPRNASIIVVIPFEPITRSCCGDSDCDF